MRRTIMSVLGVTILLAGLTVVSSTISRNQVFAQNLPPVCDNAAANPDVLWPPNHKWNNIAIKGVFDPDGGPVTINIISITQDEPINGLGDGNTCPDGAGVGTPIAKLRAERSRFGDGRVYVITFSATDKMGALSIGEVTVSVPHDMGNGHFCIDSGHIFDSTECPPPGSVPVPEGVEINVPEAEAGKGVCRTKVVAGRFFL